MKILIAVQGTETEEFFRRMAALISGGGTDGIHLAHVIDAGPRSGVDRGRDRYFGRHPMRAEQRAELTAAEESSAQAALQFARAALIASGLAEGRIQEHTLRGKPGEAILELAEHQDVDLVMVGARPGRPGPHSLGKTSRFLVDHAPRAVLLVRRLE